MSDHEASATAEGAAPAPASPPAPAPAPAPAPTPAMPASVVDVKQSTIKVTLPRGAKKGAKLSVPLADSAEPLLVDPPPFGA